MVNGFIYICLRFETIFDEYQISMKLLLDNYRTITGQSEYISFHYSIIQLQFLFLKKIKKCLTVLKCHEQLQA